MRSRWLVSAMLVTGSAAASPRTSPLELAVDYNYEIERADIARERVGDAAIDPLDGVPLAGELRARQSRHVVTPRAQAALSGDGWLSVALPIVLRQSRELVRGVDQAAADLAPADGVDLEAPGAAPPPGVLLRGRTRRGLDQVHVGVGWAPMRQDRDPTKPTWTLGAELRLATRSDMQLDRSGVGRGIDELRLTTSFARELGRIAGRLDLFWQVPIHTRKTSLFQDPGFGATSTGLGQQAGVGAGFTAFALDDRAANNRVALELGGRFVGHFEGRDYSELWELFAFAGQAGGPLALDADPTEPGEQTLAHPGITNHENYLTSTLHAAVRAEIGALVELAAVVDVSWQTAHMISFADAGIDLPTCAAGVGACEESDNDLVNPGTAEINPLHAPGIDLVGHRFQARDSLGIVFGVHGTIRF